MLDDKEPRNQNDKEEKKDSDEEVEDILNQLSEKDDAGSKKKEEPKEEEPAPKADSSETEDVEDIGSLIEEKPADEPAAAEAKSVTSGQPEELSAFQRVVGIFLQPQKVFEYLREKPEILVPVLLTIIIAIVSSFFVYDIAITETISNFEQRENIPDEQREIIIDSIEQRRTGAWRYVSIFLFPVLGTLIIFALVALVYWFVGNVILGGKTSFKHVFSTFAYSYLILTIAGTIIKLPLMIKKETIKVLTSPAIFIPQGASDTALFRFLNSFDIFTVWMLIVFGIGFATIYRFSKQKAILGVFIPWLLFVLIFNVALGSFFSQFTGQ
jgi:hypothetical protein